MRIFLVSFLLFAFSVPAKSVQGENMYSAQEIIAKLGLEPLDGEGGYFRQTYSRESPGASGHLATAIYYLVTPNGFSALHRLKSDEIFHFYSGDVLEMIQISPKGELTRIIIGADVMHGQVPQVLVPRGTWQGTKLVDGGRWALTGTTMAPGFEVGDFELGDREKLIQTYPQFENDIVRYSRVSGAKANE